MLKAKVYNQQGEEKGDIKLDADVFGVKVNETLVHQAINAFLGNRRTIVAHTKTRSEVRGGGRKPWRQKGTGRARHGSIRSPLWVGGGVVFGPRPERNYAKKINKKMKAKALLMALSDKAGAKAVAVLEELKMAEPKTKEIANLLNKIKISNALIVIEKMDKNIMRSARNLASVGLVSADSLNVYDVLRFKNLLLTKAALAALGKKSHKKQK